MEVWIVGWVLALAVGAISAMDILTTTDTCDYLWINFFCAWHFSWYRILGSSNVTGWVAFSLDGFYVCPVAMA